MSVKSKKKILIPVPTSKIYLPFNENQNIIPIAYLSKSKKANILSNSTIEDYYNIIPGSYQIIPNTIDPQFEKILNDKIINLGDDIDNLDKLFKIFICQNKLVDLFPNMEYIDNLEKTIKILLTKKDEIEITNLKYLYILQKRNRTLSSQLDLNNRSIDAISKQLISNNEPIIYSNPDEPNRLVLDRYILPNRKNFQVFINTKFIDKSTSHSRTAIKKWNQEANSYIDLYPFPHQKFVSDYLSDYTPYRGLLLYHGLGSGKSGASILIGEGFISRRVVILLPASIRNNYVGEIETFGEIAYKKNFHWIFIKLPKINKTVEKKYIELLESKGINKELYQKIIKNRTINNEGKKVRGIWMIDYSKNNSSPNYPNLGVNERNSLDKQISIMFRYKYTICHYNAGQYTITKILEKLVPEYSVIYSELFGSRQISSLTNNDRDKLLNYIYNNTNNISNPFDNKVLIVDEIHNLTSSMAGSSYNAARLYEMIMRAKNLKIVLLSGTPVINTSYELALMFNILRGFINVFTLTLVKDDGLFNPEEILDVLRTSIMIDRFELKNTTVKIVRNPKGFINNYDADGEYLGISKNTSNLNDNEFIAYLRDLFKTINYSFSAPIISRSTIFPDILDKSNYDNGIMLGNSKYLDIQQAVFNETYISQSSNILINTNNFMNRIIGLVSFYNEISSPEGEEDIFPDKIFAEGDDIEVSMSNYQFIEYASKRRIERELENTLKRRSASQESINVNQKIPNLFKVFTRQKGLFVFPPHIERPKPPRKNKMDNITITSEHTEIKNMLIEITMNHRENPVTYIEDYINQLDEDKQLIALEIFKNSFKEVDITEDVSSYIEYLKSFDFGDSEDVFNYPESADELKYSERCIKAIGELSSTNLTLNSENFNLSILSPKYVKMLQNINNSPGLVFMYSQFRTVEGIEIFARVLVENGYTRLVIKDGSAIIQDDDDGSFRVGKMVRYLKENGEETVCNTYKIVDISDAEITIKNSDSEKIVTADKISLCKFSLWTGSEGSDDRNVILNLYNSLDNMWGYKCMLLMTTQSGAEGISLKFVRQVHIMEPYWNNVRIDQVIGRARRIKSHIELPIKDRNVKIFNYVIKYTQDQISGNWVNSIEADMIEKVKSGEENGFDIEEFESSEDLEKSFRSYGNDLSIEIATFDDSKTSDELLVEISHKKEIILNQFLDLMKKVSIDCVYNKIDNVRSNSELENLTCYPTESTFNISEGPFIYEITTNDIVSESSNSSGDQTKIVKYKRLIIPFTIGNRQDDKYTLKFIVNLPRNINSFADAPNKTKIFDYYIFNGINPDKLKLEGQLIEIGEIINNGNPRPNFKQEFIAKFKLYRDIEDIIAKINSKSAEIQPIEIIKNDIITEYAILNTPTWKCISCQKDYPDSIDSCSNPGCTGITKEMSIQYASSNTTSTSTKSSKSLSIVKKRRKKKK